MSTLEERIEEIMTAVWVDGVYEGGNEIDLDQTAMSLEDAYKAITALVEEEVKKARREEINLACENWEINPTKPATYMIDRLAHLKEEDK